MPIEEISDLRRYPRLARIRLGIKKEGQKGSYPAATDYFVCPEEVEAVHGPHPTELPVMFPADDLELVAPQWYKCYSYSQGLICKGNGKTCKRKVDVSTGDFANRDTKKWEMADGSCDPHHCPMVGSKQCRRMMSLLFILPEVPGLGVYQLDTSSFYSIYNINSQLGEGDPTRGIPEGFLRQFTKGRIAFIPLILSVGPQVVTPPGEGRKTVHVLSVRSEVKLADIIRISGQAPRQVLLGAVQEEEPPDDLYPEGVIGEADESEEPAAVAEQMEHDQAAPAQAAGAEERGGELPYLAGNPSHPVEDNCNCHKPVPATEVMESQSVCYHRTCGGYLCTPPIDCYPGCPHMPLESDNQVEKVAPVETDNLGGGEAAPPQGDVKDAETTPPGKPGQPLQLGEAVVGEAALSSPRAPGAEAPPVLGEVGEGVAIDLQQLQQTMKRINWTEDTAKTWLTSQFKVSPQGKLTDVLARLTREQAEQFVKELQDRAAKAQPHLFG